QPLVSDGNLPLGFPSTRRQLEHQLRCMLAPQFVTAAHLDIDTLLRLRPALGNPPPQTKTFMLLYRICAIPDLLGGPIIAGQVVEPLSQLRKPPLNREELRRRQNAGNEIANRRRL